MRLNLKWNEHQIISKVWIAAISASSVCCALVLINATGVMSNAFHRMMGLPGSSRLTVYYTTEGVFTLLLVAAIIVLSRIGIRRRIAFVAGVTIAAHIIFGMASMTTGLILVPEQMLNSFKNISPVEGMIPFLVILPLAANAWLIGGTASILFLATKECLRKFAGISFGN